MDQVRKDDSVAVLAAPAHGRRRFGATSAAISLLAGATLAAGPAPNATAASMPAARLLAASEPAASMPGAPLVVASATIASAGNPTGTGALTVINTSTNLASTPIKVDADPVALGVSSNGATAYVVGASNDDTGAPGALIPVSTSTDAVGKTVKVPNPIGVAVPPSGNTVYVLGGFDAASQPVGTPSDLYRVDTATGAIGKVIKVASNPSEIAVTPNGRDVYVLGASEVTPVVTATFAAEAAVKLTATGIAVSPNSNTAYFLDPGNLEVVPLVTASDTRGKPIGTGPYVPAALAVSPNGQELYVVGTPDAALGQGLHDAALLIFNTATGTLHKTVNLGPSSEANGWAVTLTPNGQMAYALGYAKTSSQALVVAVNTATGVAGSPIHVGFNSSTVVASPRGAWVYVLDAGTPPGSSGPKSAGSVVPIDVSTGKAGKPIPLVPYAQVMATS
jgi:DNA-binding beta-propeller fold protein YncE